MFLNLFSGAAALGNPATGDAGLSPIFLVLIIICAAIIIGCIIWALVLSKKNAKIETTVITVSDEPETEQTVVEDIAPQDGSDETSENTAPDQEQ